MPIVYGAILPHPPLLIPAIGGQRIKEVNKTKKALEEVAKRLKAKDIDSVVIISPHGNCSQVSVPVYVNHVFEGNFAYFGADKPVYSFKGDAALANEILKEAKKQHIEVSHIGETFLDHGVLVPLYYPMVAGFKRPIVPIALAFLPYPELFNFGETIRQAADNLGKKVAVIASGDMSHRLSMDSPAGYSPEAKKFDEEITRYVSENNVGAVMNMDHNLIEAAGECGFRSIVMLLGALKGLDTAVEVLSYEGPFGVGYLVATFDVK